MTELEVLRPDLPRGRFRSVLFDFDGTLSLIREGWPLVMIPMMVDVLKQTGTAEDEPALTRHVEDFVMRLNGGDKVATMSVVMEDKEAEAAMLEAAEEQREGEVEVLVEQQEKIERIEKRAAAKAKKAASETGGKKVAKK